MVRSSWLLMAVVLALASGCTQPPTPIVIVEDVATQMAVSTTPPLISRQEPARNLVVGIAVTQLSDIDRFIDSLMFEALLTYDANGTLQPLLTTGMPQVSADDLTWTVTLKPGLTFTDGSPLGAERAAALLGAVLDEGAGSSALAQQVFAVVVDRVSAAGADLQFILRTPMTAFPELLAEPALALRNEDFGTGPFMAVAAVTGPVNGVESEYLFEANQDYHNGDLMLPGIVIHAAGESPDQAQAIIELLERGEVDLFIGVEAVSLPEVTGFERLEFEPAGSRMLVNPLLAPLDDSGVRAALTSLLRGDEQAAVLLANAGLPDGFDLPVTYLEHLNSAFAATLEPVNVSLTESSLVGVLDRAPHALIVETSGVWFDQWMIDQLGWSAAEEIGSIVVTAPQQSLQAVQRSGFQGLGRTVADWPRITAETTFPQ